MRLLDKEGFMTKQLTEEKCEGCGICIGGNEESFLIKFREKYLCSWCVKRWQEIERMRGRVLSFEEYTCGDKIPIRRAL